MIKDLAVGSSHVRYRNSKLTHLLQESLNSQSKKAIIATISCNSKNLSKTSETLKFMNQIKKIQYEPELTKKTFLKTCLMMMSLKMIVLNMN